MNAIREQTYESILACVSKLYECDNLEQLQRVALSEVPNLVGCDHVAFQYVAPAQPVVGRSQRLMVSSPNAACEHPCALNLADQPILKHYLATGDARAYKLSDFLSVSQYHSLPLYKDHYRELRYEDLFAFILFQPGAELISVALARSQRSFTEQDRQTLNLVRPYLARAYRRVEQNEKLRMAVARRDRALENTRLTSILLDAEDRPLRFGQEARQWVSDFFPQRPSHPARLPEAVTGWLQHARHTGSRCNPDDCHDPLVQERESQRLGLWVIPGLTGSERILVLGRQTVSSATRPTSPQRLTCRETEILLQVEEGKSNDEVGTALGISSLTVRTHLEHIFYKLRVQSRTGAVTQFRRLAQRAFLGMSGMFCFSEDLAFQVVTLAC